MKNLMYKLFLIVLLPLLFTDCDDLNVNPKCVGDIAVTALDAPAAVASGSIIEVICFIRNVVNTLSECTDSGAGRVTVTCGYSEEFEENFNDYEVTDEFSQDLKNYAAGDGQMDEMEMPTNRGPGYYAMKVEVESENDNRSSNNARAVAIEAY